MPMQRGDLVFASSPDFLARLIRFAQKYDSDGPDSKWNHVAVLDEYIGGNWTLIQADPEGVTMHKTLMDLKGKYEVVALPASVDREKFLTSVIGNVGKRYDWLAIVSCAISAFLPRFLQFRSPKRFICSSLVATGLHFASEPSLSRSEALYWQTPAQVLMTVQHPLGRL